MLAYVCRQRGHKFPHWARHKYREKFGGWPAVWDVAPIEPSPEVLAWVRSRMIAYAKAMQKVGAA
jgi:DNA repair protein RadD